MNPEIESTPAAKSLINIYHSLPIDTLAQEEERLRTAYAEIGGKIIAISQVKETKQYEHTLFTQDT
jgi:hypothetical protein